MYDEYPDRVMLDRICRQICQDIERESAAAQNPLSVEEFERVETYELGGNTAASPAGMNGGAGTRGSPAFMSGWSGGRFPRPACPRRKGRTRLWSPRR